MRDSQNFRKRYESLWIKYYGEYANTRSVKHDAAQRANLKLPYAFTTVEGILPQLVDVFMSERPYINVEGFGPEDQDDAEKISYYLSYQLDRMKFFKQFVPFLKNLLIYGTSIAKTPWITRTRKVNKTVKVENPITGMFSFEKKPSIETEFDGPQFETIDIFDFFPDPGCTQPGNIQSMKGCAYRVFRTMDELEKMQKKDGLGIYENLDALKRSIGGENNEDRNYNAWYNMTKLDDQWALQQKATLTHQEPGLKQKGKIELWEYWGEYDDGSGIKEYVITVANGDTVIRCEENPFDYKFKPFVACINYLVPNEFYGIGDVEEVYALIKEATALRNARLDQANLAVNRMWIVDRNSGINLRNLYSRSGGIILTNDMNGIRELNAPEVPMSAYKEIPLIEYDMQNATGQINAAQGTGGIGRAFATTKKGVEFLQSYTASRVGLKVKQIENWVMEEYGKILLMQNRQFIRQDQFVKLLNDEDNPFVRIEPDLFWKDYDFTAVGAMERLNKQQRQYNLQNNIIPFLQTVEQAQPNTLRMENLVKRYFKEFDYKNVNELVNTPEERQKLNDQQDQIKQQNMLQQIELEKNKDLELSHAENQTKLIRDAQNAQTKQEVTQQKGMFEIAAKVLDKTL